MPAGDEPLAANKEKDWVVRSKHSMGGDVGRHPVDPVVCRNDLWRARCCDHGGNVFQRPVREHFGERLSCPATVGSVVGPNHDPVATDFGYRNRHRTDVNAEDGRNCHMLCIMEHRCDGEY